jgi:hypothetical protein
MGGEYIASGGTTSHDLAARLRRATWSYDLASLARDGGAAPAGRLKAAAVTSL